MKYFLFLFLPLLTILLAPKTADARIGESRSSLEGRLFDNGGDIYRNKDESKKLQDRGPYASYMKYLGSSATVQLYFKPDDGRKLLRSDFEKNTLGSGWELHVLYVSDKSVFELYKRVGRISEYEINALLGVLANGQYWEEAKKKRGSGGSDEDTDEEEEVLTVFGFDYLRSDGAVRAKKSGGGLIVFQKQLDEFLAKQHESRLMQNAPQSVQGF